MILLQRFDRGSNCTFWGGREVRGRGGRVGGGGRVGQGGFDVLWVLCLYDFLVPTTRRRYTIFLITGLLTGVSR